MNPLLSDSKSLSLPVNVNSEVAANNIGNYFVQKVNEIYDHLAQNNVSITEYPDDEVADNTTSLHPFNEFTKKGCSLDSLPTSLVLRCLDNLLPTITIMLNLSLQTDHFVDSWKDALVTPLLKKCGLGFA